MPDSLIVSLAKTKYQPGPSASEVRPLETGTIEAMDDTLPDDKAITAPVPPVDVTVEDRFKAFPVDDITHIVVQ
jgi:hypothetical protein